MTRKSKIINLASTESSCRYTTYKNPKKEGKLLLMKYDKILRKRVKFKEEKID